MGRELQAPCGLVNQSIALDIVNQGLDELALAVLHHLPVYKQRDQRADGAR
jgi:hypothetical protein